MTNPANGAADGVQELVRQREQLRAWIAKLDEVQTGAPSRVAERVRADYQERLRRVTEELSAHGEEIQRALEEQRQELAAAEERRAHAADALEETRLRHLIGELDEGAWDQARLPLEAEAAAADDAVSRAQGEVERLAALSGDVAGGATPGAEEPEAAAAAEEPEATSAEEGAPGVEAPDDAQDAPVIIPPDEEPEAPVSGDDLAAWITEVEAEVTSSESIAPREDDAAGWDPLANEFGGGQASPATQPGDAARDLPWLGSLEGSAPRWDAGRAEGEDELAFLENLETPAPAAEGAAPAADLADDDLAFLEELDRAISGGAQRPAAPQAETPGLSGSFAGGSGDGPGAPADPTEEQPKRGEALLCKECGAINEPQAWYCEICGSEL
ncbi:MAG: hypothetical protein ACJ8J0_10320 [Longimicrobiaceae bacterium]